jgi:hypothetical protein
MTKLNDNEIQDLLENKLPVAHANQKDVATYKLVFDNLNKKPAEGLPLNFARKLAALIQLQKDRRISVLWYALILLFIGAAIFSCYLYFSSVDAGIASIMAGLFVKYKWMIFFAGGCFLLIEYLDRKVVRKA